MNWKLRVTGIALSLVVLAAISGCASSERVSRIDDRLRQLEIGHKDLAVRVDRVDAQVLALQGRQEQLAVSLSRALDQVNAGSRRAVDEANRVLRNLDAVQKELERVGELQRRFKPVKHGDTWLLVYEES